MDAQQCDFCRLCLGVINGCDEILLNNNPDLTKTIFLITGLEVVPDSGQREYVCGQCQSLLDQCVEFRENCINNDSIYREMMSSTCHDEDIKSEFEEFEVECIKLELVDLEDLTDDVKQELENEHMLSHEVNEPSVAEDETGSKKDSGEGKEPFIVKRNNKLMSHYKLKNQNQLQHNHNNPNRRKLGCTQCSKKYLTIRELKQHMNAHHHIRGIPYACDQCGKQYFNYDLLKQHCIARHSGENRYPCPVCGEKFPTISTRFHHQRSAHPAPGAFACKYCDKTFHTQRQLNCHTSYHNGRKQRVDRKVISEDNNGDITEVPKVKEKYIRRSTQCQQCGKRVDAHRYTEHLEIHHNPSRKKLACKHCPKEYLYTKDLKAHIHANHTPGVLFACDPCGRTYTTQRSFDDHQLAVHSDERRYACKICGEKLATTSLRATHQRNNH